MKLFNVYPLYDIEPVKGDNCWIFDKEGNKYLDLYGGHAVVSIGHSHPAYVSRIGDQLSKLGFYSNSIQNSLQVGLAEKLGELTGCEECDLFLCNSGAEANENAFKVASFHTGEKKIISFKKGFHGRTSAAVAVTDNPKIIAPVNENDHSIILPLNDIDAVENEIAKGGVAAVIIEGIQGIGGIHIPEMEFMKKLQILCNKNDVVFILDEIQSGYGRSGKFFAHEYFSITPDIITIAKGMGNGFPVGGVIISPKFEAWFGMLGTTFGGNHLACAASIAVLDVIKNEHLVSNSKEVGGYLLDELSKFGKIKDLRGKGLMIGIELDEPIADIRKKLLFEEKIFTGVSGTHTIRLLPPLTVTLEQADMFLDAFQKVLTT